MDKAEIFYKLEKTDAVYLYDDCEDCVMKLFVGDDGETVKGMLKRKGEEPYIVDITSPSIFDIMCESDETTEVFYKKY